MTKYKQPAMKTKIFSSTSRLFYTSNVLTVFLISNECFSDHQIEDNTRKLTIHLIIQFLSSDTAAKYGDNLFLVFVINADPKPEVDYFKQVF